MTRARDLANSADKDIAGTLTLDGLSVEGNIAVTGTVDGRDVNADGTKLDGIETAATADQTKADIDSLNVDADTLDGQHGAYYTGYADTAVSNAASSYATASQGATADTATQPSDLTSAISSAASNYATAAQGATADTATQPSDLGTAATTAATDYATAAQGVKADASVQTTATTGQANLPTGTTAQRTGTPATGALRFNSTDVSFEGYNGTEWGSIGGGAADGVFYENEQNITGNYTIAATKNAMTTGPITIASGVSVTIETGARWVVL